MIFNYCAERQSTPHSEGWTQRFTSVERLVRLVSRRADLLAAAGISEDDLHERVGMLCAAGWDPYDMHFMFDRPTDDIYFAFTPHEQYVMLTLQAVREAQSA